MYWQGETHTFCSPFRPKVLDSGGNPELSHFTHQPVIEPPHKKHQKTIKHQDTTKDTHPKIIRQDFMFITIQFHHDMLSFVTNIVLLESRKSERYEMQKNSHYRFLFNYPPTSIKVAKMFCKHRHL